MPTQTLSELEQNDSFCPRHIGPSEGEQEEMLRAIGQDNLAAWSMGSFQHRSVPKTR